MFDLYLSAVIFGLGISGILFLVSIGISIGFGLMRIINMEQMVYYTFGAYMTYALVSSTGSFMLGLIAGTLVAATAGFLVETQLLRRVYGKELMFTMVVTFSVFMIGIGLVQYGFGLAGIENPDQVQGLGINIRKIFTITFVVASGLAGFGGALNSPLVGVTPYMGFDMLLFAFITVILGGLGSIKGTLVSSLIMGQVMSVGGTIYGPLAFVGPFMVMFVVILFRPTGLYGVKGRYENNADNHTQLMDVCVIF
jgi:branched-chain amino acid transport system permease protein